MPWYEWENGGGITVRLKVPGAELDTVGAAMARLGYRRRYFPPQLIVVPTYWEACNQVAEELEAADHGYGPRAAQKLPENIEELARMPNDATP